MCAPGTWVPTPTGYSYSWQRNVTTTIGGSSDEYTLTAADVGQAITCTVVAQDSSGSSLPAVSVPIVPTSAPINAVPIATSLPSIQGIAVEGQTVTCLPGAWANSPSSYAYSWQRDGLSIAGQVASRYTLSASDVSQAITCLVVASNAAGSGPPALSLPVIPLAATINGSSSGGGSGGTSGGGTSGGTSGKSKLGAPNVMSFSVSPRKLVVTVRGRRQQTKGMTFSYRLSQAANVQILVERSYSGRIVGGKCVAHPPRRAKGRRCTGYLPAVTLTVRNARAALDHLKYAGKVGRSLLASGNYRGVIAASNAGGRSNTRWAGFTVVRKAVVARARLRRR
jgi:hypothetical protein